MAPKQSRFVGVNPPLLCASVGRKSPRRVPRISGLFPNTLVKHLLKSYLGRDFTAQHPEAFLSPCQFLSWGLCWQNSGDALL